MDAIPMNELRLYSNVIVVRDLPKLGLTRGDRAALVEKVPHPQGGPDGFVLELFNQPPELLGVVIVTADDIVAADE
jgi:hypothetical protein